MSKQSVEHQEDAAHQQCNASGYASEERSHLMPMLSHEGRMDDVTAFAETHDLREQLETFEKAASLVQSHLSPEDIPGITDAQLDALRLETEHKWRQPKMLYFVIMMCSIAAIEQGWAQSSMNGANLYFPKQFGIDSNSAHDTLIVGLINSGIYLSTGVLGAWISDPINASVGRRGALMAGSIVCLLSNVSSALSWSWPALLAFRFALGLGLGLNTATASIYAAECAPASIRGGLAVSWQMFVAFGIFLGFVANAVLYDVGNETWRWQLLAPAVPTVPLVALLYACPESPAWYLKRGGRYELAYASLRKLRNTDLQAAKEIYAAYLQGQLKKPPASERSFVMRITELFSIPRCRRATLASYTVMLSQQLCGINIIAFYSSTIFSDAGFSTFNALLASCVFGFVNFLGAFPAVWTMDTLGRRTLLLYTLPFMALTMFAAGTSFYINEDSKWRFGLLVSLIYLFCAEYSPGMGPVPCILSAEVFPLSHREIGMSFAVATANVWASVLSLTFPRLLAVLKPQGAFTLYAILNAVAFVLVFLFVPETRQKTLDELDEVFSVPTRRFIKYQTIEALPWIVRRHMLKQKQADLPALFNNEHQTLMQHGHDSDSEELQP